MMQNLFSSWKNPFPVLLIAGGAVLTVVGLLADYLGLSDAPGFGPTQIVLTLGGLVILSIGFAQQLKFDWQRFFVVSGQDLKPVEFLRIAVWFGLVAGFTELLVILVRKSLVGSFFQRDPELFRLDLHLLWMTIMANLVFFSLLTFLLLILVWRWRKILSLRLLTFLFIFLSCSALTMMFPVLHTYAAMLLAAGVAAQISKLIAKHANGFHNLVRRTTRWMFAGAVGLCLCIFAWEILPEQRALAQLPTAKPGVPNVLLLILDTVRAKSLSFCGYSRSTSPRLKEFAKKSVHFTRALATSPWTLPSHASIFTGRFPHELFADQETPLNALTPATSTYPTLAEVLSDNGYLTGGFVANMLFCSYAHGLSRGFAHYEDYPFTFEWFVRSSSLCRKVFFPLRRIIGNHQPIGRKSAADLNHAFLNWIEDSAQRPFLAFINYFDAHDPYLPPAPFDHKFGTRKPKNPHPGLGIKYDAEQLQAYIDAYDGSIAYLDHQVGSLLDELQKRGVLENTVVIITSDHGEQFGEHGFMGHTNSLYRQLIEVPLLISFPASVPAGKKFHHPVSLRDLPATIIDLVGLDDKVSFPGLSLARAWKSGNGISGENREACLAEFLVGKNKPLAWIPSWPGYESGIKSLVAEGFHYIRYGNGREELYDFAKDPEEINNLADSAEVSNKMIQLRSVLKAIIARGDSKPNLAKLQ